MTNTVNLFPFLEPINEKDTVLSAFGLATPFGRSVAYTALYTGANFVTLPSTNTLREDGALAAVGSPTQLSSVLVCLRGIAQVPQRIKQTYSAPLTFPVNQHLPFCFCQCCTRYPAERLIVIIRTNSHTESLTASILNHARSSWLFPLAWRHKQAALFEGSMSKDTLFDKQVFRAARLRALGALANSMREIAVAGPCFFPVPSRSTDIQLCCRALGYVRPDSFADRTFNSYLAYPHPRTVHERTPRKPPL